MPLPVKTLPIDAVLIIVGFLAHTPEQIEQKCISDESKKSKTILWSKRTFCCEPRGKNLKTTCNRALCLAYRASQNYEKNPFTRLPRFKTPASDSLIPTNAGTRRHTIALTSLYLQWYECYCALLLAGAVPKSDFYMYIDMRHAMYCYFLCRAYNPQWPTTDSNYINRINIYCPARAARCLGELSIQHIVRSGGNTKYRLSRLYPDRNTVSRSDFHKIRGSVHAIFAKKIRRSGIAPVSGELKRIIDNFDKRCSIVVQLPKRDKRHRWHRFFPHREAAKCISIIRSKGSEVLHQLMKQLKLSPRLKTSLKLTPVNGELHLSRDRCSNKSYYCSTTTVSPIPIPYAQTGYPLAYSAPITIRVIKNSKHHALCCILTGSGVYVVHAQYGNYGKDVVKLSAYRAELTGKGANKCDKISMLDIMADMELDVYNSTDIGSKTLAACRTHNIRFVDKFDIIHLLGKVTILCETDDFDMFRIPVKFTKVL